MHPQPHGLQKPSVSLVLPAWNESEVIVTAIEEADVALRSIADRYEIIVVDDGSTDDTAALVESVAAENPSVKLVRHNPNQGYGAALRSGFAAAEMDLVAFTDADCQFDLSEMDRFVLLSKRYDVVCGYRIDRKDTALRCLYSKVYNLMVRALLGTGVRDVDCALKMFRREAIKDLRITGNGFLVNSEMLVQANQKGFSVVEVGVSHRPRTAGESTVSIHHIPKVLASMARYWWNEVQFPTSSTADHAATSNITSNGTDVVAERAVGQSRTSATAQLPGWAGFAKPLFSRLSIEASLQIALLIVAAAFLFSNLHYPLIDRDETRYAEIPREMLATGNWVLPQLNFQPYYDKPPLVYWLCAVSYKIFGINEFAARMVPALCAWLTIAATMWFGTRNFGRRVGLIAGMVLMLSVGFVFTSRYLLLDGVLSLLVAMSFYTAYEAIKASRVNLGWWTLCGIFVGLGVLAKGPIALVLWLPPVFAMAWLSDSVTRPSRWHYALIGLVMMAVAAPWFVIVSFQDAHFVSEFFITHNIRRFAGEFHTRPFWFFIPVLLIAGHPWSFLTLPFAGFLFGRAERHRTQRPPLLGFLLLWSVWSFVFFSLSQCKLPTYLLPIAPALALMMGHYLNLLLRETSNSRRYWFARFWSARTATATTCFAGVAFVGFTVLTRSNVSIGTFFWGLLWTSLLVSSLLMISERRQVKMAWMTSSAAAFLLAVMVMHQIVPSYSRSQTLFGDASPLGEQLAIQTGTAIATVEHEFSEVPFYLDRRNIPNFSTVEDKRLVQFVSDHPGCVLVVENRVAAEKLRRRLPESSKLTAIGKRGPAAIYRVDAQTSTPQIAQRTKVTR
ncbi:MAG: glycosyltransferase [Planctomycetales bacterium]|nr:glycosyltransferase [Planctomycetales bacterium]